MILFKLVSTYEVEPPMADGEPFAFRFEIFSDGAVFIARFFRYEFIRMQPTFPQLNGEPDPALQSDEMVLVRDAGLGGPIEQLREASEQELLRKIAAHIAQAFPG